MNSGIIYDNDCPACSLYTKAFVNKGFLKQNERINFSEVTDAETIRMIDWTRAKNEIPFINQQNNKVYYGAEALVQILGTKITFFNWFSQQRTLMFFSKKLYAFVSYNRRTIIPAAKTACATNFAPSFSLRYRLWYLFFTWVVSSAILSVYSDLVAPVAESTFRGREFFICGGQIFFQALVLLLTGKRKNDLFEYLGNMMTISFAGALLLLPALVLHAIFPGMHPSVYTVYFLFVAFVMFLEHLRRMKLLQFTLLPSITWVLYRLMILILLIH